MNDVLEKNESYIMFHKNSEIHLPYISLKCM